MEKKKLSFDYEGKKYEIGFNRETVAKLNATGFHPEQFNTMRIQTIETVFYYSLKANHPNITKAKASEMHRWFLDKIRLWEYIADAYNDVCSELYVSESEIVSEKHGKNSLCACGSGMKHKRCKLKGPCAV